jgi:peptidyl-prolyl cis-trans isomerase D
VLEQIVQKFRGIVLFGVVFLLSGVFVLQFGGPQAEGCGSGGAGPSSAAKVYGDTISRGEFRAAYVLAGGENYPAELAKQNKLEEMILYGLIERDLLAREAKKLGYYITEDEVLAKVASDGIIHLSVSVDAGPYLPPSGPQRFDFSDTDGTFNKDNLKNFIQYRLRRSIADFTQSQVRETLAQRMREAVVANITVGPGEVWDAYVREKESAKLKYLRFSKTYYSQKAEATEAEMAQFIIDHKDEIDAEYEKEKHRYTGLEKQVRARHILIKVPAGSDEEQKQQAREKIEALLEQARGGADFAKLAADNSEDTGSAKKGGDLGYNPRGRMVKPFDEAQFALEVGQISDVVESTFGFHIIKVEGIREGDVPVDEAKGELANTLYRDIIGTERAEAAAQEAAAKLAEGMTLEEVADAINGITRGEDGEPIDGQKVDPLAPSVRETRPFGRTDSAIPGAFDSSPLVKAAYELSEDAPKAEEPMQLGDDFFVYELVERTLADEEGFTDEERERIAGGLLRKRQRETLIAYVRQLRDQAEQDNALEIEGPIAIAAQ